MKTTLGDLRVALHEQAHLTPHPDVEALVTGARRRVGLARRRRLAALAASTAAVLVIGGLVATTSSTHRAALQPAVPGLGSFTVNTAGAGFPEFIQGMRRVTVLEAPMLARMKGSISIPTTPGEGLSVQMTCTGPKDLALNPATLSDLLWLTQPFVSFTTPGGRGISKCWTQGSGGTGEVIGVATGTTTVVSAGISLSAPGHSPTTAAPKGAKIHAAIYETVPWKGYPFPLRPTGAKTPVWPTVQPLPGGTPDSTVVSGALTRQIQGPTSAANANNPLSVGWPYDPKSRLVLQVRGPGRLRVLLDGNNISAGLADPCFLGIRSPGSCSNIGAAAAWATPLRDGYLTYWNYDHLDTTFPLDPQIFSRTSGYGTAVTVPKLGEEVSLVIIPEDFTGPDWRVVYEPIG